jgi:hypothetical protein
MTRTLKRLRPLLLLTALLLLANCQEDLYDDLDPAPDGQYTHRILTGPEALGQKQKLVEVLKANSGEGMAKLRSTFTEASTSRLSYEDLEPFISYDAVLEMSDGKGQTCYTYTIKHPDRDEKNFFNIVMKVRNNLRKINLIQYAMADSFAENVDRDMVKFSGNIIIENLVTERGFPCPDEPEGPIPIDEGENTGGGYDPGTGSWGGNPGVHDPGSNIDQNQLIVSIKLFSLTMSGSNPRSDHDGGFYVNDQWMPKPVRMSFNFNSSTECGGDQEIGVLVPDPHPHNCEELAVKSANANFSPKMAELKAKAGSQNFESAYGIYDGVGGLSFSDEFRGSSDIPEVEISTTVSASQSNSNLIGFMHCHLNNGTTYKVFSFADLCAFGLVAKMSTRATKELCLYVTTASGTFALKVRDRAQLKSIYENKMKPFSQGYEREFQKYLDLNDSVDEQIVGLLNFIDQNFPPETGGLGIDLYQQNEEGNWERLKLTNSGKSINRKPCN